MTKHDIIMLFSSPEVALLLAVWSAPRIAASVLVQPRKFTIYGLPGKSDKSDWLRIRNEYSDANAHLKRRARHLGTRMDSSHAQVSLSSSSRKRREPPPHRVTDDSIIKIY